MFTHHIITILLLVGSYWFHFTPTGNVVLILMDPSDILLSVSGTLCFPYLMIPCQLMTSFPRLQSAKCLRYMGWQKMCDVFFGLFMACWVITRHVFYGAMLWSCIRYATSLTGPTDDSSMAWGLTILLCALQCLLCIWLVMICKLAWKVISGQAAEDERSDEESPDEEEIDTKPFHEKISSQTQNSIKYSKKEPYK